MSNGNGNGIVWLRSWWPIIAFLLLQTGGAVWFAAKIDARTDQAIREIGHARRSHDETNQLLREIEKQLNEIRLQAERRDGRIRALEREHGQRRGEGG